MFKNLMSQVKYVLTSTFKKAHYSQHLLMLYQKSSQAAALTAFLKLRLLFHYRNNRVQERIRTINLNYCHNQQGMRKIDIEMFTVLEDKFPVISTVYTFQKVAAKNYSLFFLAYPHGNIDICKGQNRSTFTIAMKELISKVHPLCHNIIKYQISINSTIIFIWNLNADTRASQSY